MAQYTSITVIYNPNSTGNGEELARQLKTDLATLLPGQTVELVETEHAGHGQELAYQLAGATSHPLIISASGDGGYHDVINGLMTAAAAGAHPVGGLLPAGNANDHFHSLHDEPVPDAIKAGHEQAIDLLKITTTVDGKPYIRFAHSYIGIGLTPKVGAELNKTKLNIFNEIGIVIRVLLLLKPVRVLVDGQRQTYDSLIFSNIKKMSKVLNIAEEAKVDDGRFEITAFRRRNKLALIAKLLKATASEIGGATQATEFRFTTIKPTLVQMDGEIATIDANSTVIISLVPAALRCIV